MKMINSIGPIDIQIDDNKRFSLVALLVDRDDFLTDIQNIRKQIGLTSIPYILPSYPIEGSTNILEAYNRDQLTINGIRTILEEECLNKWPSNLNFFDKILGKAVVYSEIILKKYKKTRPYFSVIFASILAGKVTDFDFPSTYMLEFNNLNDARLELENFDTENSLITIAINPQSTQGEVLETFNFIQKYRYKTKKTIENNGLRNIYIDERMDKPIGTLSAIKDTRKLYWLNKNKNISAKKIWNQLGENNAGISEKGIEKALTKYKKLLRELI